MPYEREFWRKTYFLVLVGMILYIFFGAFTTWRQFVLDQDVASLVHKSDRNYQAIRDYMDTEHKKK